MNRISAIGAALDDLRSEVHDAEQLTTDRETHDDLRRIRQYLNWCVKRVNNIEERTTK